jgi:hypothetical protein
MNSTRLALILAILSLAVLGVRNRQIVRARSDLAALQKQNRALDAVMRTAESPATRMLVRPGMGPSVPPTERRQPAVDTVFRHALPDGTDKSRASRATSGYLGRNLSLDQLRECVKQSRLDPVTDREFRTEAAASRLDKDSDQRMTWALEACRDTAQRVETISSVVERWAAQDINDTGDWLNRQTAGPEKDAATSAFALKVGKREPPTAIDWACTITNPDKRNDAIKEVARLWRESDPEAANAYMTAKGLK